MKDATTATGTCTCCGASTYVVNVDGLCMTYPKCAQHGTAGVHDHRLLLRHGDGREKKR